MGITAIATIVVIALVAGLLVQSYTNSPRAYEWLIVALAAAFGALFASESFPGSAVFSGISDWGPTFDGMSIIPAIIGGVLLGLVADIGIRFGPEPRVA